MTLGKLLKKQSKSYFSPKLTLLYCWNQSFKTTFTFYLFFWLETHMRIEIIKLEDIFWWNIQFVSIFQLFLAKKRVFYASFLVLAKVVDHPVIRSLCTLPFSGKTRIKIIHSLQTVKVNYIQNCENRPKIKKKI